MSQTGKTTGNLKMRSGPGMEFEPPIAYLVPDTALEILAEQGDWLQVKVGDKTGYVSAKYVMVTGEAAPAAPAPVPAVEAAPAEVAPAAAPQPSGMKKADQEDEEPVGPEIKKPDMAKREPAEKTIGTGKDRVGGSLKDD